MNAANAEVYAAAQAVAERRGMGTTLTALLLVERRAFIAHVGDSRLYLVRGSEVRQLTEDHSLLNDYIKMKNLTPEEIEAFPHKNVIVRALGMKETVQVDVLHEVPQTGDVYLLCSDGLSGMVTDEHMAQILSDPDGDLDKKCERLIDAANANGGTDNITVILVRYEDT